MPSVLQAMLRVLKLMNVPDSGVARTNEYKKVMTTHYAHGIFVTFSYFTYSNVPVIDVCVVVQTFDQQMRSYGDLAMTQGSSNRLVKPGSQTATPDLSAAPRQLLDV